MIILNATKAKRAERMLIVLVLASLLAAMVVSARQIDDQEKSSLRTLDTGWYRYVGELRENVTLPCQITVPEGQDLVLYYEGLTPQEGSRTLVTRAAVYDIKIQSGDHVIYEYSDRGFKRNQQMKSKLDCIGILPDNLEGTVLSITYHNTGNNVFRINPVQVGRSGEVLRQIWYQDIFHTLCIFTMSIIGVICICAHFYLKYIHIRDVRMGSAAMFLLLCGAWCMLGSSIAQQVKVASANMGILSIYCFMCLPIPVLHFVKGTRGMEKYKSLDVLLYLTYGNVLGQSFIHVLMNLYFIDLLPLTHILHVVSCAIVNHLLAKEYAATKDPDVKAVLQSMFILIVSGMVDIFLYWGLHSPHYGLMLQIGVLAFIIRMLFALLASMTANIRFKAEAMVYRRLSREDRLTGLANRRAFDEALSDLELHADQVRDAALFFLDVNGLKAINDRYGHNAGDELIISAARCLSNAFAEYGTCYRIGGDEFAAIVKNPGFTHKQWEERIDQAVLAQNSLCHWNLSIAWGVSFLLDRDGSKKRSSDWLYEADQDMYKMKSQMKAARLD